MIILQEAGEYLHTQGLTTDESTGFKELSLTSTERNPSNPVELIDRIDNMWRRITQYLKKLESETDDTLKKVVRSAITYLAVKMSRAVKSLEVKVQNAPKSALVIDDVQKVQTKIAETQKLLRELKEQDSNQGSKTKQEETPEYAIVGSKYVKQSLEATLDSIKTINAMLDGMNKFIADAEKIVGEQAVSETKADVEQAGEKLSFSKDDVNTEVKRVLDLRVQNFVNNSVTSAQERQTEAQQRVSTTAASFSKVLKVICARLKKQAELDNESAKATEAHIRETKEKTQLAGLEQDAQEDTASLDTAMNQSSELQQRIQNIYGSFDGLIQSVEGQVPEVMQLSAIQAIDNAHEIKKALTEIQKNEVVVNRLYDKHYMNPDFVVLVNEATSHLKQMKAGLNLFQSGKTDAGFSVAKERFDSVMKKLDQYLKTYKTDRTLTPLIDDANKLNDHHKALVQDRTR